MGIFFILAIIGLIILSAICSGLNIALMSLSTTSLKRQSKLGNKYAKRVLPLRKNSHLSLASLLLCNIAAVSATSVLFESKIEGLFAVLATTLLLLIFGELLPQALFTRFALKFCYYLAPVLWTMIVVTYPVTKLLQLALDRMIGHAPERLHSRDELGYIISEHLTGESDSELDESEAEIIQGALGLSEKRVRDIAAPINKVYYLSLDTLLDDAKIDEIKKQNRSRIPILSDDHTKCHGVLLMKTLVDIDFDTWPIHVSDLKLYQTKSVGSMTALDTMFHKFIASHSHLMPVTDDGKIVAIVTIEDLIEEIFDREIVDEADMERVN
jgi:metal transporter CNNM